MEDKKKSFSKTESAKDWKERLKESGLEDWVEDGPESLWIRNNNIKNYNCERNTYCPDLVVIKVKDGIVVNPLKKDMDYMGFSIEELQEFYNEAKQKNDLMVECLGFNIQYNEIWTNTKPVQIVEEHKKEVKPDVNLKNKKVEPDYKLLYDNLLEEFKDYKSNAEKVNIELINLKSDLLSINRKYSLVKTEEQKKEQKRKDELARYHSKYVSKKPEFQYIKEMWNEYHACDSFQKKKEIKKSIYREYYILRKIRDLSGEK